MIDATRLFVPKRLAGRLILWFGGLSLIVLLVTGYYLGRMTLQELAAAQGEALHARARAAAIELSNSLIDRELEIGVLSQAPHMLRGNWAHPDVESSIERRATTDALTGLYNRRRLHDRLDELLALNARTRRGFAVMMLDIDHFKRVNDTHGHDAGDQVLKTFAQLLRGSVRETDVVARFGGEEFTIALTETATPEAALCVAEKIRAMVESTPFPIPGPLTVSIGVHIATPKDRSVDDLVKAADGALYAAKRGGRNRVTLSSALPDQPAAGGGAHSNDPATGLS